MFILYKNTAILSSAILLIVSICPENHNSLFGTKCLSGNDSIGAFFSIQPENLFFQDNGWTLAALSGKVFAKKSITRGTGITDDRISNVFRKIIINSDFLSYSVFVNRNFTIKEIVFPFQNFW